MLDPIQERFGDVVVVLVYIATLCGDVFWTASILVALGRYYL
jgi:high affinity choline transporter 7